LTFRVIQAPMANNQPAGFAAAVCRAGAVGFVAGGTLRVDELRAELRAMPRDAPFGVNLFAPPYLDDDALQVVLEERPPLFSFTMGVIDPRPLQELGIEVLGTATSVEEAEYLRAAGVDGVVAQGAEAGGHRGSFLDGFPLVPLAKLVPAISGVPVYTAGGIATRADVHAARELGAAGVVVGTAFLFTHECARPREHLEALRTYDTVLTDAYTGRPMRAARDPVLQSLIDGPAPLPFPQQRLVSAERGPLYMGGTGAKRCREQSVADLVAELRP
jgi:NAD(P)H-dependent flavin oxidoreductase YrpB (nitropropane dioxygenase family)